MRSGHATRWDSSFGCRLLLWAAIKAAAQRTSIFARTYHQRLELLDGKLTVLFLSGMLPNTSPIAVRGTVHSGALRRNRNRSRLAQDATVSCTAPAQAKPKITKVVATHAHEEHVGNLNWLSELLVLRSTFRR